MGHSSHEMREDGRGIDKTEARLELMNVIQNFRGWKKGRPRGLESLEHTVHPWLIRTLGTSRMSCKYIHICHVERSQI